MEYSCVRDFVIVFASGDEVRVMDDSRDGDRVPIVADRVDDPSFD